MRRRTLDAVDRQRAPPDSTAAAIAPAYHQSMGEAPDDDAPTEYTPTELSAASLGRTLAAYLTPVAVGICMGFVVGLTAKIITYLAKLPRRFTRRRIIALAVVGSLVLVGVAACASWQLRDDPPTLTEQAPPTLTEQDPPTLTEQVATVPGISEELASLNGR